MDVLYNRLCQLIKQYNPEELDKIAKAYLFAYRLHMDQKRDSGEPYIIHPLTVACYLASFHADSDTVCAGLLHDLVEDTNLIIEDIQYFFNDNIATLVDGVTKLSKIDFYTKEELNNANMHKLLSSMLNDIRIIFIKLVDRLHNMETLNYKNLAKQKEKASETLTIFVPLASFIGAYELKNKLEDLSLKYLNPHAYEMASQAKKNYERKHYVNRLEMINLINNELQKHHIEAQIEFNHKNIYSYYKKILNDQDLSDCHELLGIKIIVDRLEECYQVLGIIHQKFHCLDQEFRDFICNPRTNKYQSIHTSIFGVNHQIYQIRIRTKEMDQIAAYGLGAYWDQFHNDAIKKMQANLVNEYQFFQTLSAIDQNITNDYEFIQQVKKEILNTNIYVYNEQGDKVEFAIGSTIVDYIVRELKEDFIKTAAVLVNGKLVDSSYQLQYQDRINILTSDYCDEIDPNWEKNATSYPAQKLIREHSKIRNLE